MVAGRPRPACLRTLVSASCTIRYAARSISAGSGRGRRGDVCRPAGPRRRSARSSRSRPGRGAAGRRLAGRVQRVEHRPHLAQRLGAGRLIASGPRRACSGSRSIRCAPTPARTLISDRWWPSTSCSSRAIRSRSSLACRRSAPPARAAARSAAGLRLQLHRVRASARAYDAPGSPRRRRWARRRPTSMGRRPPAAGRGGGQPAVPTAPAPAAAAGPCANARRGGERGKEGGAGVVPV